MQLVGAAVGCVIVLILYPDAGDRAGDVIVPHPAPARAVHHT
jgi:hypothetical protein